MSEAFQQQTTYLLTLIRQQFSGTLQVIFAITSYRSAIIPNGGDVKRFANLQNTEPERRSFPPVYGFSDSPEWVVNARKRVLALIIITASDGVGRDSPQCFSIVEWIIDKVKLEWSSFEQMPATNPVVFE